MPFNMVLYDFFIHPFSGAPTEMIDCGSENKVDDHRNPRSNCAHAQGAGKDVRADDSDKPHDCDRCYHRKCNVSCGT